MKVEIQQVSAVVGFMVSGLLVFAVGCLSEKQAEDVSVDEPATEEVVEKTFTANIFCAACHYAFGDEELAKAHEEVGIGCERCHGESERHRSDEDNVTPPEIMYPKDKINPTCMMCHPRHDIEHVPAHDILLAGAKTIFDADSEDAGSQMYCTTCHAAEHRINVRTIRWNKSTGEILDD